MSVCFASNSAVPSVEPSSTIRISEQYRRTSRITPSSVRTSLKMGMAVRTFIGRLQTGFMALQHSKGAMEENQCPAGLNPDQRGYRDGKYRSAPTTLQAKRKIHFGDMFQPF